MLAAETEHRLEVGSERVAKIMARRLMVNVSDLTKFITFLCDIDLICMSGDGFISSERMNKQARATGEKRANGKRGGRPKKNTS